MSHFVPVLCAIAAILLQGCSRPLTTEAYVWQQQRSEAVDSAIARAGAMIDTFALHVADVSFREGTPDVRRFEVPWEPVAKTGRAAAVVIRIPSAQGGLGGDPEQSMVIGTLIRELLDAARRAGVPLREVQIDYDCPVSKLVLYAQFLRELKAACPQVPIVFTALPSWMRSDRFGELARTTNGYVLQVHSLELPGAGDARAVICDEGKARKAIRDAEKFDVPFRVALPTYQCVVLLDEQGRRVSVVSEGGIPSIGENLRPVAGASDPAALAELVAELRGRHSSLLTGVIWYRLPVDSDRMNWQWPTFEAVANGRRPASDLRTALVPDSRGYASVEIRNSGQRPEPWPASMTVRWQEGAFEAADGLNGYEPVPAEKSCRFELRKPPLFWLPPGKTVAAGWIRIAGGVAVDID